MPKPWPNRDHLLDFLFNGWEHDPNHASSVDYLVQCDNPRAFAEDLMATWEVERPDLYRSRMSVAYQQAAAEELVDRVVSKHSKEL